MVEVTGFGTVLLFIVGGLIFIMITLLVGKFLRPSRPNEEKLTTYESGEDPLGSAWGNFNIRFYVIALIFLLFEVELVFLFPWATVFGDAVRNEATQGMWGWFSLAETIIFIGFLAVGLLYVWKKKMLDWVKPEVKVEVFESKVPEDLYQNINQQYQ